MRRPTRLLALLSLILALAGGAAAAQDNRFAPEITVNDSVITGYEIDQRIAFLQALRAPRQQGLRKTAVDALIDDRLRMQAARGLGVQPTEEEIRDGMAEFAGRADLELDPFLQALAAEGIAEQTLRDFVEAGTAWREVVRTRFGPRAQVTESEVDRAIALSAGRGGARVRLAEIILPANTPERQARAERLSTRLAQRIESEGAFSAAARQYSAAPSRARGGVADWRRLSDLPPQLARIVITLSPGEVSEPVPLQNAIALFQLRDIDELEPEPPEALSIDYARFLAADRAAAERVAGRVDTCDDLYGVVRGLPEDRLTRQVQAVEDIPAGIAAELERLDANEVSTRLTRGNARVVLMLCGRTSAATADVDRGQVRSRLRNQRLSSYADGYLAELRADAIIRRP